MLLSWLPSPVFEYGAILKGSQTKTFMQDAHTSFEYGAILKGSQTVSCLTNPSFRFEYGAILKGSQTFFFIKI